VPRPDRRDSSARRPSRPAPPGDPPEAGSPPPPGRTCPSPDSASSDPTTNAANNPTNSANLKTGTGVATTDAPLNPGGVGIQNSGGGLGLQANGNSLGGNIGGTIPTDPTGGTSQISLLPGGSGPQVAGAPAGGLGLNGGSIAGSPAAGLNTTQLGGPNSPSFFGSLTDAQGRVLGGVASGGLQMVGGMLNGMNQRDIANQQMALEQQRINQTSYGNTYANYQAPQSSGIINKAMA